MASVNNVFCSANSYLGTPVSRSGDLPQLTGGVNSMSGIDMHVFDVTALLSAGTQSASVILSSTSDAVILSALILSTSSNERMRLFLGIFSFFSFNHTFSFSRNFDFNLSTCEISTKNHIFRLRSL